MRQQTRARTRPGASTPSPGFTLRQVGPSLPIWLALAGMPIAMLAGFTLISLVTGRQAAPLSLVIPSGRRLPLFLQTVGFALAVSLFGTLIGLLGAGASRFSQKRVLRGLPFAILPMAVLPPYIHALVWGSIVRDMNRMFSLWGWAHLPEQGFGISVWVQGMALLPFAFGILYLGFRTLPDAVTDAARILGSGTRTAFRVLLPLQAPSVSVTFLFLFLVSLLDYSVPSIFQLNLYTLTIFSEYSIRYDAAHAFLLSMPMLAISIPAVWGLQKGLRHIPLSPTRQSPVPLPLRLHPVFRIPVALALFLCLLQMLAPLLSLTGHAIPFFADSRWFTDALPDLVGTVAVGLLAALLTMPLSFAAADAIHTTRTGHRLWWWLLLLPLALPAPLVGIGLIHVWNTQALGWTGLYQTLLMPALASTLRFLPFSVLVLLSAMKRQDSGQTDAVRMLQRTTLHGLLTVRIPLLGGALAGAGLLATVLSFGELGATLLLLPPGAGSLTIKIYNYLHYGQSDVVAGLCLVLFLLALSIGLLLSRLMSSAAPGVAPNGRNTPEMQPDTTVDHDRRRHS